MTEAETLLSTPELSGFRGLIARVGHAALRASLRWTPKPMAHLFRKEFSRSVAARAARQLSQAPPDIVAVLDETYAAHPDARLDVYVPSAGAEAGGRLPTVVWTHGGAFVGGSKEEIGGYLRMIAHAGFTVVGLGYSLAPEEHYPTPVRQLFAALAHLRFNAARLHVDPSSIILVGDSAGAQISAQCAALATNPRYARKCKVTPSVDPEQLRGVALCCGIYDLTALDERSPLRNFFTTAGWAYSGVKDFQHDPYFASTMSLTNYVTPRYPPTFVTVGNADPLVGQSTALVSILRAKGIDVETLLYAPDHEPPLGHEYQFDLELDDGRAALARLIAFFERCARTVRAR